ncbi:MAG: ribonuclease [Tsuneonella sp.]
MADWLVEQGIGEDRAILVERDQVLAARLRWPGELRAGLVVPARLAVRRAGSARGLAHTQSGAEIFVDKLPAGLTEGRSCDVLVTRAPIAERGRLKRAQGRAIEAGQAPPPRDDPFASGEVVRRFPAGLWDDVWDTAWDGELACAGGSLLFSVTPAMTLIDVDGDLPPRELALAAVPALARALEVFDLGGSIDIDFPTIEDKRGRRQVDEALGAALAAWPHERTAMNGFGFVQIVARLEGPSLLHRMASARAAAAARMLLRRAEALEGSGATLLSVHPAIAAAIAPEWLDELARRTGREVRLASDPALALGAGHAQVVPR